MKVFRLGDSMTKMATARKPTHKSPDIEDPASSVDSTARLTLRPSKRFGRLVKAVCGATGKTEAEITDLIYPAAKRLLREHLADLVLPDDED